MAGLTTDIEVKNLANGIRVVLIPDDSVNSVLVGIYFRNGARQDPPDALGASYLYQYLMFYGTENTTPYEQVFFINKIGGTISGKVSHDYSFFYNVALSSELSSLLWFEGQRLRGLRLKDIDIEEQRNLVLERATSFYNNNIIFRGMLWIQENVLANTSYRNQLFGTLDSLKKLSPEDVRKLYSRFFCQDNILLIVCGNYDRAEADRLIDKEIRNISLSINTNDYSRSSFSLRRSHQHKNWLNPGSSEHSTIYGYKVPAVFDRDWAVLNFISYYLSDRHSRKLREMIRINKIRAEVETTLSENFGSNMLTIRITTGRQSDLEISRYILTKEIENLTANLLANSDVKFVKKLMLYDFWKKWQSLEERSLMVANSLNYFSGMDFLRNFQENINRINSYDILRTARKYLSRDNLVILNIYGI